MARYPDKAPQRALPDPIAAIAVSGVFGNIFDWAGFNVDPGGISIITAQVNASGTAMEKHA